MYAGEKGKKLVGRSQTHTVYLACHRNFWGISVTRGDILGSRRELVFVITCRSESLLDVLNHFSVGRHPNLCLGCKNPKFKKQKNWNNLFNTPFVVVMTTLCALLWRELRKRNRQQICNDQPKQQPEIQQHPALEVRRSRWGEFGVIKLQRRVAVMV